MTVLTGRKYPPYKKSRTTAVPFTANHRGMLCSMYLRLEELERHHELAMRNSTAGILALIKISKIAPDGAGRDQAQAIADEALSSMGLSLNQEIGDEQVDK